MTPRNRKGPDLNTFEGRFAARLTLLRTRAKLTVEEAAAALGITAKTIYVWESATQFPHISIFPKIAEVYKLKTLRNLLPDE